MKITQSVIFWDWNGTLLDDAKVCVEAMNSMLNKRCKSPINIQKYKSIFGFPVINYYKELGFNFDQESFEDLSTEFIANYNSFMHLAKLQPYTLEVLDYFHKQGKKQVIISAMEQSMLIQQTKKYEVAKYFTDIKGISNIFAKDKSHLAQDYLNETNEPAGNILFIGDTLHDKEVADKICSKVLLVSNGHQSSNRLSINGNKVISNLNFILNSN